MFKKYIHNFILNRRALKLSKLHQGKYWKYYDPKTDTVFEWSIKRGRYFIEK